MSKPIPSLAGPEGTLEVEALLATLEHPLVAEIQALRTIVLAADPRVAEGIKWNSPSFFYRDWFATFNLRAKDSVQVVLHTGAKVKASRVEGVAIDDPDHLLKWLAKDRCLLTLADMDQIRLCKDAIEKIVCQWLDGM